MKTKNDNKWYARRLWLQMQYNFLVFVLMLMQLCKISWKNSYFLEVLWHAPGQAFFLGKARLLEWSKCVCGKWQMIFGTLRRSVRVSVPHSIERERKARIAISMMEIQRSRVIGTVVKSDNWLQWHFFLPKCDLLILKIFGYCESWFKRHFCQSPRVSL